MFRVDLIVCEVQELRKKHEELEAAVAAMDECQKHLKYELRQLSTLVKLVSIAASILLIIAVVA